MAPRSGQGTKKNVYSRRAAIRSPYHKLIYKMKTRHDSPVWVFLTLTLLAWFAEVRAQAQVQDIADIHIRDPFILPDAKTGTYYMYRSSGIRNGKGETIGGVEAFKSKDLVNWEGPIRVFTVPEDNWITGDVWAPEVHRYKGKYYLFATLNSDIKWKKSLPGWVDYTFRGTQVFRADSPEGPFLPFGLTPHTPMGRMALDGTLWVEDGIPYMIYCHEWVQITDGSMELVRLADDLSAPVGDSQTLFHASAAPWSTGSEHPAPLPTSYVTDGCFLYRTKTGKLLMIWSSFMNSEYAIGIAESVTGKVAGPWKQHDTPLFNKNGGHGMIFRSFDGRLHIVFHGPNSPSGSERAKIYELEDTGNTLALKKELPAKAAEKHTPFWGKQETYLANQTESSFELIHTLLKENPPSAGQPAAARKAALQLLDGIFHDTRLDGSEALAAFMEARMKGILEDMRTSPKEGMKIYKLYNDGFIVKTRSVAIAFDLYRGPKHGARGLIADETMRELVARCDIMFLSHNHPDHIDPVVVKMFTDAGKPVVAPANSLQGNTAVTHIRSEQIVDREFEVGGGKLDVKILPGHQSELINNIHVITTPEGLTLAQTGDQYSDEDLRWLLDIKTRIPELDVLLLNCWVNRMPDTIEGFAPKLVITGHENELGHTIDHRESYWASYLKLEEIARPNCLMTWGETYWYKR